MTPERITRDWRGPTPEILHLNLRREYFEAIVEGCKRVEPANARPTRTRLERRKYDVVKFRKGYSPKAPEMIAEFRGIRRYGAGDNAQYAIALGRVIKLTRWRRRNKVMLPIISRWIRRLPAQQIGTQVRPQSTASEDV